MGASSPLAHRSVDCILQVTRTPRILGGVHARLPLAGDRRFVWELRASVVLVDGVQQSGANQIRRVSRAKLAHGLRPMTLERARADLHPQRALLVGISLADELQDLAFTLGQRLLTKLRRDHDARRTHAL